MESSTQFNLHWNNYATVLQNVFYKLLEREEFVDVTLACEGQSIKCHRLILSACSTYLARILQDNPSPNLVILLKDMQLWELKDLVTFMYKGEINVSPHKLQDLLKAAEALEVKGLSSYDTSLSHSNVDRLGENVLDNYRSIGVKESPVQLQNSHGGGPIQRGQSMLRQQNNLSAYPTAVANRQPQQFKRKILTQLPQLVKLQRVEQQQRQQRSSTGTGISGEGGNLNVHQFPVNKMLANKICDTVEMSRAPISQVNENNGEEEADSMRYVTTADSSIIDDGGGDGQDNDEMDSGDENELSYLMGNDSQLGLAQAGEPKNIAVTSGKAAWDSVLYNLQSGITLRQCSQAYGIPKKALSKRKSSEVKQDGDEAAASPGMAKEGGGRMTGTVVMSPKQQPRGPGVKAAGRAELFQKATELAMSGIPVSHAAAFFEIPRTTLCAYMKRHGLTSKHNFLPSHYARAATNSKQGSEGKKSSEANSSDTETNDQSDGNSSGYFKIPDFPFPDNSELMNEMSQGIHEIEVYAEGDEECSE